MQEIERKGSRKQRWLRLEREQSPILASAAFADLLWIAYKVNVHSKIDLDKSSDYTA